MSNVIELRPALHPERRTRLKSFLAQQAAFYMDMLRKPEGVAAAMHIVVTGDGVIETRSDGVDPVHAAILLNALDNARAELCRALSTQHPEVLREFCTPKEDQRNVVSL